MKDEVSRLQLKSETTNLTSCDRQVRYFTQISRSTSYIICILKLVCFLLTINCLFIVSSTINTWKQKHSHMETEIHTWEQKHSHMGTKTFTHGNRNI